MTVHWEHTLRHNRQAVEDNLGPGLVAIVSGSQADQRYWESRFNGKGSTVPAGSSPGLTMTQRC
jgi:hypothetical protein